MGEKLVVGPINKGLRTDRLPFVIDNDSFPNLINAFQWRGRVKRKRGTRLLNRLQIPVSVTITLSANAGQDATLPNTPVAPGTINFVGSIDGTTYTDPLGNGILTATGGTGSGGTINYLTGLIHIAAGAGENLVGKFSYYPCLPVMGLEDIVLTSTQFPGTIAFDTQFAYNIPATSPYTPYNVSYFKNPASSTYPGYTAKSTQTAFHWNGQNYQQFWSTNYLGAFWATNGIAVPFNPALITMQFNTIADIVINSAGPPATATIVTGQPHNLVVGDFVFINEVQYNFTTQAGIGGINLQTGYVISTSDNTHIQVEFPNATLSGGGFVSPGGIVQYLTNTLVPSKDCLKWYDGDPTTAGIPSGTGPGWVNFCPPLSLNKFSISGLTPKIYYLVGARMIIPFKDRMLFFGAIVQASDGSAPIYLQDTVVYSQNGTPYYTCSFTDTTSNYGINPTVLYTSILVPTNQTATPSSYFADNTGFGGFVSPGVDQPITTIGVNEDALIVSLSTLSTRLVYTGSDFIPFNFYIINAELGSASTFSTIVMDEGVLTRGTRGFIMTNQVSSKRFDLDILDRVFQVSLLNNGNESFCAQRDFINEWVYFTYLSSASSTSVYKYPNQTLQYNYRDQSWGIFNETYTTYGQFRAQTGDSWQNINFTWNEWNQPWDDGVTNPLQPLVIGGNQQGFILFKDEGTSEDTCLFIQNISGSTITSPDHGLNNGDYIIINGCVGTIGSQVNGKIFSVNATAENTFVLSPPIASGTYTGAGLITRLYVPEIQSKQFPLSWGLGRKTRIGVQQYLLSTTAAGQVQLLIYLSQNDDTAFNDNNTVPINDTIYSTVLYTCPEGTNLGLTPANINLQMPFASVQNQTWHRINTSLIGDTVQFEITLSDAQMRQFSPTTQTFTITGTTAAYPCVLTTANSLSPGQMIQISGVQGMTQLNNNPSNVNAVYQVISANNTTATINVDSSAFSSYTSGGTITVMQMPNQESEVEFHGCIIDISPSQMLS